MIALSRIHEYESIADENYIALFIGHTKHQERETHRRWNRRIDDQRSSVVAFEISCPRDSHPVIFIKNNSTLRRGVSEIYLTTALHNRRSSRFFRSQSRHLRRIGSISDLRKSRVAILHVCIFHSREKNRTRRKKPFLKFDPSNPGILNIRRSIFSIISRIDRCPRLEDRNEIARRTSPAREQLTPNCWKVSGLFAFFFYPVTRAHRGACLFARAKNIYILFLPMYSSAIAQTLRRLKRLRATFKVREYLLEVLRRIVEYLYNRLGSSSFVQSIR